MLLWFGSLPAWLWHFLIEKPASAAPLLVTLIAPLVALAAIIAAWVTARSVARQKATIDLIEKAESTEYYQRNNAIFSKRRRGEGFLALNNAGVEDRDRRAVLAYLNHYELVALGIRKRVLDGRFYRQWMGSALVRDWNAAADFIRGERWKYDDATGQWEHQPLAFRQVERLAIKWAPRTAARIPGRDAGPPEWLCPGGPGNEPLPELADAEDSAGGGDRD